MSGHDAFPNHIFNAFGQAPRMLEEKLGGVVMVIEKRPEGGPITLMTAGASNLPTDSGEAVELAVEVVEGQQGAGFIALRIVCDDIAEPARASRRRAVAQYRAIPHWYRDHVDRRNRVALGCRV
ncbi:hypothetical protein [Gulosibacter massiliensis]|uniref:hypothetical protein n=1 Tax=Gulosibacter massiliensis TaxID=2479839 RepID=UPI001F49C7D4|nr:hypothetical protein [Gulosibacter massiliensis]